MLFLTHFLSTALNFPNILQTRIISRFEKKRSYKSHETVVLFWQCLNILTFDTGELRVKSQFRIQITLQKLWIFPRYFLWGQEKMLFDEKNVKSKNLMTLPPLQANNLLVNGLMLPGL